MAKIGDPVSEAAVSLCEYTALKVGEASGRFSKALEWVMCAQSPSEVALRFIGAKDRDVAPSCLPRLRTLLRLSEDKQIFWRCLYEKFGPFDFAAFEHAAAGAAAPHPIRAIAYLLSLAPAGVRLSGSGVARLFHRQKHFWRGFRRSQIMCLRRAAAVRIGHILSAKRFSPSGVREDEAMAALCIPPSAKQHFEALMEAVGWKKTCAGLDGGTIWGKGGAHGKPHLAQTMWAELSYLRLRFLHPSALPKQGRPENWLRSHGYLPFRAETWILRTRVIDAFEEVGISRSTLRSELQKLLVNGPVRPALIMVRLRREYPAINWSSALVAALISQSGCFQIARGQVRVLKARTGSFQRPA